MSTSELVTVGVVALVTNAAGEVLVLKHSYRPHGPWGFPAGQVQRGERFEAALRREFREETGWRLGEARLLWVVHVRRPPEIHLIYRAKIAGGAFRPSAEITDARFLPPEELEAFVGRPYRHTARRVREHFRGGGA